tara:strand:- start:4 stop:117 length:114 start_codon:yes stop_codon:yes gene_type:complete
MDSMESLYEKDIIVLYIPKYKMNKNNDYMIIYNIDGG